MPIEIKLRKRNKFERLVRLPKYFLLNVQIGKGRIPVKRRILSALIMSKLLMRG